MGGHHHDATLHCEHSTVYMYVYVMGMGVHVGIYAVLKMATPPASPNGMHTRATAQGPLGLGQAVTLAHWRRALRTGMVRCASGAWGGGGAGCMVTRSTSLARSFQGCASSQLMIPSPCGCTVLRTNTHELATCGAHRYSVPGYGPWGYWRGRVCKGAVVVDT